MPVYVEIAGRAYPLRFTLRGALRLLDLTGQTPMELLAPGLRNTALLLYAALCDGCPHVTLSQAAALCAAAARERDALSRLLSALALALAESGLDQTRLDRAILRRLLRAAGARAIRSRLRCWTLPIASCAKHWRTFWAAAAQNPPRP